MRLLVTGGAGFIGSNFVHHVVEHTDHHVTVLDKLTYAGNRASLDGLPESRVRFVQGEAARYASSAEACRHFCARCGSQLAFTADYLPGLIDIAIGSLDRPEAMAPSLHYWESRRLPWLQLHDGLPRYAEFPPQE